MLEDVRAELLGDSHYDIVAVHDPQPLALAERRGDVAGKWVWRCHIHTSEPAPGVYETPSSVLSPLADELTLSARVLEAG
jgi:trehalose synthase